MYVNAFIDNDEIVVIERINGERIFNRVPVDYSFYVKDKYGDYKSIFGDKLKKITPENKKDFYALTKQFDSSDLFESDINRVFKHLSENYNPDDVPDLKVGFIDIEVGFTPETKYSNPDEVKNEIISVSITDKDTSITTFLAIPPSTLSYDEAKRIADSVTDHAEILVTEHELIKRMLELIQPYDVLSGWNSEAYDIKYIINRIIKIMDNKEADKLCLCGQSPRSKTIENKKFKRMETVYDLIGRIHLDYMQLYKKYTYTELSSYSLDNVSYVELDEKKIEYSGTLDTLYKKDFEKFVEYNIKDTELIYHLDAKLKFIDTTNIRSHQNGVTMSTAMGTVGIVEQAIINEGHIYYKSIFPNKADRNEQEDESGAAGAYVVKPKKGIRKMVSGVDINSLYPSTIRACNMSPETLVGQVLSPKTDRYIIEEIESGRAKNTAEAWQPLFNTFEAGYVFDKTDDVVEFEFNSTKEIIKTEAKNINRMVFDDDTYCITANGTLFSRKTKGIIPHLLERWYSERKIMQKKADEWEEKMMSCEDNTEEHKESVYWYGYWYQRQLAKKIDLNALYGALLNKYCRFYDKRIGQSTTLTGRSITRHMASKINEIVTGVYDHTGNSIIYGDSVSKDTIINTNFGKLDIEKAFLLGQEFWNQPNTNKEYSKNETMTVKTYDPSYNVCYYGDINYIYRHKTNKPKWKITDEQGNTVTVTGDHSLIVERNNMLCNITPSDMKEGDVLISTE